MKKTIKLLFAALMALAFTVPAMANNQLTVFDGDDYAYAPINFSWCDEVGTRTQVIYPAADLAVMTGEVINSIKFYTYSPTTEGGGKVNILVGETSKSDFTDVTYVEGLTHVTDYVLESGVTEVELVFDTPYLYNGGNFVIETLVEEATNYSFIYFTGVRADIYNTLNRNEIEKFLPKATFDYGVSADYSAKVVPSEVTFNTIRAERTDVQNIVLTNNGLNDFTPAFSTEAPFSVASPNAVLVAGHSLIVPVTFAPMTEGTYAGTLTIDCGGAGILEVPLNGVALEPANEVVIGDENDYASFVPIYGTDIDIVGTQSQMIYSADKLTDMVGGEVLSLKFFTKDNVKMDGGVIQLSLKIVDDAVFAEATPATELTAVATVTPVLNGTDLEFTFDQPYAYNGGNLLVDCTIIEAGTSNYQPTYFYGTPSETNVSLYTYDDYGEMTTDFVPFLPKALFTYKKGATPEVLRGDVNQDGTVAIADVTTLIDMLLSGAETNTEADCNLDGTVAIADVTCLIDYLLSGAWPTVE